MNRPVVLTLAFFGLLAITLLIITILSEIAILGVFDAEGSYVPSDEDIIRIFEAKHAEFARLVTLVTPAGIPGDQSPSRLEFDELCKKLGTSLALEEESGWIEEIQVLSWARGIVTNGLGKALVYRHENSNRDPEPLTAAQRPHYRRIQGSWYIKTSH